MFFNGKVTKICSSFHIPFHIQKEHCCQKFLNLNVNGLVSDSPLSVKIISMQVLVFTEILFLAEILVDILVETQ